VLFHDFWSYEGAQTQQQMQQFMNNLAIMGGLLVIVGFGSGPRSLDPGPRPIGSR
jgi:putative oxidoreductase